LITGKYIFKSNGEIIAEKNNLITANGRDIINQFLAGATNEWAGNIAVGVLYSAPTTSDTQLAYEVYRTPVTTKSYITTSGSNQIVVKATCSPMLVASIYEIGLIPRNTIDSDSKDSFQISDFSEIYGTSSSSNWLTGGSLATASYRALAGIGTSRTGSYNVIIPSGSVGITTLANTVDISSYTTTDYAQFLYYIAASATGTSSVVFTLTDDQGYNWQTSVASLNSAATGYYTASVNLSSSPNTNFDYNLNSITASVFGGAASPNFDHLKLMSGDARVSFENLVSRSAQNTPIVTTTYGQPLEIEYYLTVN
jgi:hypothetical protein